MANTFERSPLPWSQVEEAFRQRLGMSADDYYALAEAYRGIARIITKIGSLQVLARVKRKLQAIIEAGGTLREFTRWIETGQALTWTRAYTELVYRMAVLGSYSKARWEESIDPDIADEFDKLMYDAVNDSRTRATHAAMDGKAWRRNDFPDEWWPPAGFNCRCEVRSLNDDLLERAGGKLQRSGPADRPDPGFRSNQARDFRGVLDRELNRIQKDVRS